ncbi:hypothetical protein ACGF1Z_31240 [Streptomyces sp. NPDC048018]|uniref:hypothetical protein n=1 Tax=Streptomyces sp. NPDC048018 TaxID=3365499 RepID=UPI00371B7F14
MTDTTAPVTGEEQAPGWSDERKERTARGCLLVIATGVGGAFCVAVPEVAYYVAGLGTVAVVRKVRGLVVGRRGAAADEDVVDIVGVLHQLSPGGTSNVRLTQIVESTGLPDTKPVRALLAQADIPIKEVRTGGKVGQGVYATAIPLSCGAPSDGCWCAVTSNNNTDNSPEEGPREGLRVDAIGQAGLVVTDPTETQRRHTKTPARST